MEIVITILHENLSIAETLKWSIEFAPEKNITCNTMTNNDSIPDTTTFLLADAISFNKIYGLDKQPDCSVLLLTTNVIDDLQLTEALYTGIDAIADISHGPAILLSKISNLLENKPDETQVLLQKILQSTRMKTTEEKQEIDYGLTPKEKDILRLMREANHLKLIAQLTNISYETVRTHVKNIYKKIGVVSASEAVVKAMKMDLN